MQDYTFASYSVSSKKAATDTSSYRKKALEFLPAIEQQIEREKNIYLDMRLPLDYAQAFLCENEREESLRYLIIFYEKTGVM